MPTVHDRNLFIIIIRCYAGIEAKPDLAGDPVDDSLDCIIVDEVISMAGIGHVGCPCPRLAIASNHRVNLVQDEFRKLLLCYFIGSVCIFLVLIEEYPLELFNLKMAPVSIADSSRQSGFIRISQNIDEIEVVVFDGGRTIHVHAEVDLHEDFILMVGGKADCMHAAARVTHGDHTVKVNEVELKHGVPNSIQTSLAVTGTAHVSFGCTGGDIGTRLPLVVVRHNGVAPARQFDRIPAGLFKHVAPAMGNDGQWNLVLRAGGLRLVEKHVYLVSVAGCKIQVGDFNFPPRGRCPYDEHESEHKECGYR